MEQSLLLRFLSFILGVEWHITYMCYMQVQLVILLTILDQQWLMKLDLFLNSEMEIAVKDFMLLLLGSTKPYRL